jgi:DNA-binding transcriptional MocR family regulator
MPVNSFDNYPLSWKPEKRKDGKPLYISLANRLEEDILSGKLRPNTMLPPQRELADYLDINLSTVTRSFKLCELKGLIYATVGRGTFVSPNALLPRSRYEGNPPISIDLCHIEPFHATDRYVHKAIQDIMDRPVFQNVLEYNPKHVDTVHKYAASRLLRSFGIASQPENLLIAAGSQNALSVILLSLFAPGDKLAVDPYTYHHFKSLANYLNLRLLPVPSDFEGMLPDRLDSLCRQVNISGLYLMPGCNNPTSVRMPLERRIRLSDVIKKHHLITLEDDSYVFLSDTPLPSFYELAPSDSIYILGTSKSLCAGLRTAFAAFPEKYRKALHDGYDSINLRISPFDSEVISELILSDACQDIFKEKRSLSRECNRHYSSIFKEVNPFHNPCSFFRWLKLPDGLSCEQMISLANRQGVDIMGAGRFAIGPDAADSYVRIALSTPASAEKLVEGLNILRGILDAHTRRP